MGMTSAKFYQRTTGNHNLTGIILGEVAGSAEKYAGEAREVCSLVFGWLANSAFDSEAGLDARIPKCSHRLSSQTRRDLVQGSCTSTKESSCTRRRIGPVGS